MQLILGRIFCQNFVKFTLHFRAHFWVFLAFFPFFQIIFHLFSIIFILNAINSLRVFIVPLARFFLGYIKYRLHFRSLSVLVVAS